MSQVSLGADALRHLYEHQLARPRAEDGDVTVTPLGSGPPAPDGPANRRRRPRLAALERLVHEGGEQAFQAYVRRTGDRRLERTAGADRGLRVVFGAMAGAYVPERAGGFAGELQYDLARSDGTVAHWTVHVDGERATARPGPAGDPALTVKLTVVDFLRVAAREIDPAKALLTGRLDLEGDFAVAQRLGEMFGQPAAF